MDVCMVSTEVCYLSLMPLLRQHQHSPNSPCSFIWHPFSVSADAHQCCWCCSLLNEHSPTSCRQIHGGCNVHANRRTHAAPTRQMRLRYNIVASDALWLNIVAPPPSIQSSPTRHTYTQFMCCEEKQKRSTTHSNGWKERRKKNENRKQQRKLRLVINSVFMAFHCEIANNLKVAWVILQSLSGMSALSALDTQRHHVGYDFIVFAYHLHVRCVKGLRR